MSTPKKLLFLDIDGVLNSTTWVSQGHPWGGHFFHEVEPTISNTNLDPACLARIRRIVDETGASIVICSAWRVGAPIERFKAMFALYGWPDAPIIGKTLDELPDPSEVPELDSRAAKLYGVQSVGQDRGALVNQWRQAHGLVRVPYVCIDDMYWRYSMFQPVVATDMVEGLTDEATDFAIAVLQAKETL